MKKLFSILMLSIFTIAVMFAQKHPSVEDMHNRKWNYIAKKISLSEDQISKVKPIFIENEKARWKDTEENRKVMKMQYMNKKSSQEVDFEKVNDQYVDSELQKAQDLKKYYSKLKKVLPPETIHAYFRAERSFRRDLLNDIDKNRRMRRRKN